MTNDQASQKQSLRFRDYQLDALRTIFQSFGVIPAGPPDDPLVVACSSDGTGQNGLHGGAGETLAGGASDDVVAPF